MTTYTINGNQYSEFDIKLRCSELMQVGIHILGAKSKTLRRNVSREEYNPLINPTDTWPIIEKVFDKLNSFGPHSSMTKWELTILQHKCTKLVAACICFIEVNGGEL